MKKLLLHTLVLLQISFIYSQVGIGTTTPTGALDINSTTNGLLIPRVALTATNIENPVVNPQGGALANSTIVYNTATAGIPPNNVVPGFYYWETTTLSWKPLNSALDNKWDVLGNSGTNASINFLGTTDDVDMVFKRNNILSGKINPFNTSLGEYALFSNTTGVNNNAFGVNALTANIDGTNNIAIGNNTLATSSSAHNNIAIGENSLFNNTIGENNVGVGIASLYSNTEGQSNNAIGLFVLKANTIGNSNNAMGSLSLTNNTEGHHNSAFGESALYTNTIGFGNCSIGAFTLYLNSEGSNNNALGEYALFSNSMGYSNNAIGYSSLYNNTLGYSNNSVGYASLYYNTVGNNNNSLGDESLYYNISGYENNAFGKKSLYNNREGFSNNAIGNETMFYNETGANNNAIGANALYSNTLGNSNNVLGDSALYNNLGEGNVAVGHNAGYFETGSNKLYIENTNADAVNALVYGEFDTNLFRINGRLQIGNPTGPGYNFPLTRGSNNQILKTDNSGNTSWSNPTTQSYVTTGTSTGLFDVTLENYTVRVYNGISEIRLPNATTNLGKMFIIIGSNGIATKTFSTLGGVIYDDVTNANITTLAANQRYIVQSDGTDWIVIGR